MCHHQQNTTITSIAMLWRSQVIIKLITQTNTWSIQTETPFSLREYFGLCMYFDSYPQHKTGILNDVRCEIVTISLQALKGSLSLFHCFFFCYFLLTYSGINFLFYPQKNKYMHICSCNFELNQYKKKFTCTKAKTNNMCYILLTEIRIASFFVLCFFFYRFLMQNMCVQ